MDFLTQEIIEKAGLTEEQLAAIKPVAENYIAEQKKAWDGKANENAEAILSGAVAKIYEKTSIARQQGEKVADYITRVGELHLASKQQEVESLKADYETKLKNFNGDPATKQELQDAKAKLDAAQKRLAKIEPLAEKATKYDDLLKELSETKRQKAWSDVKPTFSKDANPYEVDAKWNKFQRDIESKYDLQIVDGNVIAIDKENQYKQVSLLELVQGNEELKALISGRQQQGSGAKPAKNGKAIEGLPFEATEDTPRSEIQKLIEIHLTTKEGLKITDMSYGDRFKELWSKIPRK